MSFGRQTVQTTVVARVVSPEPGLPSVRSLHSQLVVMPGGHTDSSHCLFITLCRRKKGDKESRSPAISAGTALARTKSYVTSMVGTPRKVVLLWPAMCPTDVQGVGIQGRTDSQQACFCQTPSCVCCGLIVSPSTWGRDWRQGP